MARQNEFDEVVKAMAVYNFGPICFKCGKGTVTVDHHIPIALGGKACGSNAVVLCNSCNWSKGSKHPKQFYTEDELLDLESMHKVYTDPNEREYNLVDLKYVWTEDDEEYKFMKAWYGMNIAYMYSKKIFESAIKS